MRVDLISEWAAQQPEPLSLTAEQFDQFARFQDKMLAVNEYINLTAITSDADIAVKHFIDSLTLLPWIKPSARMIDIGAGAGFPGIPLKIARPDIRLTLLDSLRKRVLFLQEAADMLRFEQVSCIHARAEDWSKQKDQRGKYDICTVRAVARLSVLAGYALPFLKPGGLFLAMKGPDVAEELEQSRPALTKFGGKWVETRLTTLAPDITHSVIVIEKR